MPCAGPRFRHLRLFGKPELRGPRRLGAALARGATLEEARAKAVRVVRGVRVIA